jgi:hypothetical protein
MGKEKVMTFVEARAQLSEIVDRVAEHGDTYVVAKRHKSFRDREIPQGRFRQAHFKNWRHRQIQR